MPGPNKRWEDEEEDSSSSAPNSPQVGAVRRGKFDDEEEGDNDVLDSWDADDDSEAEREKAKKAAEAKKAAAEASTQKKSKAERIAERQAERTRALAAGYAAATETEAERRERLRREEKESDLSHAEDLLGNIGISNNRKAAPSKTVVPDSNNANGAVNLATLPLFNPSTQEQFDRLRNALSPLVASNSRKPYYVPFLQELVKQLAQDLPSEQVKKIGSSLTSLSNEKMKQEKAAEKGGKKSKAAKTKTSLAGVSRNPVADMSTYDDNTYDDGDFM